MKKLSTANALVLLAAFFCATAAFAETNIVNPEGGVWANRQMLVVETDEGGEVYYSLDGADPRESGFAYDGPVLLDMAGDVSLRIVAVTADGGVFETSVSYTVAEKTANAGEAIDGAISSGVLNYAAGEALSIPPQFFYSLGSLPESFLPGAVISYSADCILSRYVPCTISDGSAKWRFVINARPSLAGSFSVRSVPFEVNDWTELRFTDSKLIYKIDDEYWRAIREPVNLDRSVSHTISWQSIEVERGNPVETFALPPKPRIETRAASDGSLSVVIDGEDGYRLGVNSNGVTALFEGAGIDTFQGDEIAGALDAGVYFNSVYQGTISVPYAIDRRAPAAPVIDSSEENFYSRKPVRLSVQGDGASQIFVAVAEPLLVDESFTREDAAQISNADLRGNFSPLEDGGVTLDSQNEGAVYFRVAAYALDGAGNKSAESTYEVVIDKYNYYVDAAADGSAADGSRAHPFDSFEKCFAAIEGADFANITVRGRIVMPVGNVTLLTNCAITGDGDARLVFMNESALTVRGASLEINGCILQRIDTNAPGAATHSQLIKLEYSVLSLKNCELVASFISNGSVISAEASVIVVDESGIAASAANYAACISANGSKIKITSSRATSVAQTAVNFSAQGGDFELRSSSCKVTGSAGRSVELFNAKSRITANAFEADVRSSGAGGAIYADAKTVALEYGGNTLRGY